jgi:hypothetical protein
MSPSDDARSRAWTLFLNMLSGGAAAGEYGTAEAFAEKLREVHRFACKLALRMDADFADEAATVDRALALERELRGS